MDKSTALWEIEQIKQLKARYMRLLDARNWPEFRELFADDFKFFREPGSVPVQGTVPKDTTADAFCKRMAEIMSSSVISVHHGQMPEIEIVDPNTARGIWSLYDYVDLPERGYAMHGFGHYHEVYVKGTDGKWRIKESHLTRLRVDKVPTPVPPFSKKAS
ncbi:MAG TPA: nuclear transport factor 2 family protein [Burkholderiales bacterium]|nr:nuclear transport factor 2 family protein [Burkholderiales bacterium]